MSSRSAGRRADLLAASVRLFRERGFGGVSVADVAEQVGITASAVYKHFPGRRTYCAGCRPRWVDVVLERPDVVGLWHQEAHYLPNGVRDELVAVRVEGVELWGKVLTELRPELAGRQAEFRIGPRSGCSTACPHCHALTAPGLSSAVPAQRH